MSKDNQSHLQNPADPAFHEAWRKLRRFHPRRLIFWTLHKSASPHAVWWLAGISFIEAIIFPIPSDILIVSMGLAQKKKVFFFAFIATVTNVLGGVVCWLIGAYAYARIGVEIISFFHLQETATNAITQFQTYDAEIILIGAFTPVPFKVISLVAGLSSVSLGVFVLYAFLGRALRFGLIALILYFAGDRIRWLLFRHFGWLMFSLFAIFLMMLYAIRYYFSV